eukprot:SAG31_NODE_12494_length_937_cov_1.443914_1_plen_154_part_10
MLVHSVILNATLTGSRSNSLGEQFVPCHGPLSQLITLLVTACYLRAGSLIAENWCSHQGTASEGGLYPDNHSANMTFDRNVLSNLSSATNWLNIDPGANNLRISNNWHSGTNLSKNLGSHASILLEHNHFVQGAFPPSAMGIMRKSGPVKRKSD